MSGVDARWMYSWSLVYRQYMADATNGPQPIDR